MTLAQLRMWHWRQYKHYGKLRDLAEARHGVATPNQARDMANVHLGAVQLLNDLLPGTAEQDCSREDAQDRTCWCTTCGILHTPAEA
jgi:hypothetical protein